MNDAETEYAVTRLYSQQERLLAEVKACKDAGADYASTLMSLDDCQTPWRLQ